MLGYRSRLHTSGSILNPNYFRRLRGARPANRPTPWPRAPAPRPGRHDAMLLLDQLHGRCRPAASRCGVDGPVDLTHPAVDIRHDASLYRDPGVGLGCIDWPPRDHQRGRASRCAACVMALRRRSDAKASDLWTVKPWTTVPPLIAETKGREHETARAFLAIGPRADGRQGRATVSLCG